MKNKNEKKRVTYKISDDIFPFLEAIPSGLETLETTWLFPDVRELLKADSVYRSFHLPRESVESVEKLARATGKTKREILIAAIIRARDSVANPLPR